jgi:hypothetical protein
MKARTLIEAVEQITGRKNVTVQEAKDFAFKNYIELHLFISYQRDMDLEGRRQKRAREAKREQFRKMYSRN